MRTIGKAIGRWIMWMCLWGIGLCVLIGCAASAPAFPVIEEFRCEAAIELSGQTFSGTLTRASAGTLTFEMTAPDSVSGWTFRFDGEAVTLTLQGLSYAVEPAALPNTAPVRVLATALDAVARTDRKTAPVAAADGVGRTVGRCSAGSFVLLSDPKTGFLRELSVPEALLEIRFSAFSETASGVQADEKRPDFAILHKKSPP